MPFFKRRRPEHSKGRPRRTKPDAEKNATDRWLDDINPTIIAPIQGAEGYMEMAEDKQKEWERTDNEDYLIGSIQRSIKPPKRDGGAIQDEDRAIQKLNTASDRLDREKRKIKAEPRKRRRWGL
ncbi:MAG: hypothetical protein WBA10_14210 [Elainellaceae cyanobacterium]